MFKKKKKCSILNGESLMGTKAGNFEKIKCSHEAHFEVNKDYLRRASGIVNGSRDKDSSFAINGDSLGVIGHRAFNFNRSKKP